MRCHAPPKSFDTPRNSPLNLCKLVKNFTKLTLQPLRSTRPENFRSRCQATPLHAPPEGPAITSVFSRTDADPSCAFTRSTRQALTCALCAWRHGWRYPPLSGLTRLTRFDPDWPGNLTRSEPPQKKKKKMREREKMLWPSGPLTLTKKSKFSKRTCPTQFFEYIPILGPVSSFEAQKLCKCPVSKSWLLHKCWPKSKNFQEGPILPNFSRRFHFWGLFLHLGIRNCSNSMILQLLALM